MFQHQLMISCQIGFTLHSIDNHTLCFECRRRTEFHLSRETCTTQTYNTGIGYLFYYFLGCKVTFPHQRFGAVNTFFPFITVHINKDGRFRITTGIDNRIDFSNLAADRRVDGRGYETTGFGNLCADFHHISFSYNRLCRRTNVLAQQNHSFGRNFRLYNRLMC